MCDIKLPSQIDGREVTAQQYLAELACKRKAEKEKIALPKKFWNLDEWKKFFSLQKIAANALLKVYDLDVVIKAFNSKECSWMYSLNMKAIKENCEKQKIILDRQKHVAELTKTNSQPVIQDTSIKPREEIRKTGIRSKLDG